MKKRVAVDRRVMIYKVFVCYGPYMYYVIGRTIVCTSISNERMPGLIVIYVLYVC